MKNRFFGALYVLNIIGQAIFTLLTPTALFFGLAWLLVTRLSCPQWIYAIAIPIGVLIGFYSMIKTAISASESLLRLERERDGKGDKKE